MRPSNVELIGEDFYLKFKQACNGDMIVNLMGVDFKILTANFRTERFSAIDCRGAIYHPAEVDLVYIVNAELVRIQVLDFPSK